MFILLGMLAVAASDLLLLLECRNSRGFHEVYNIHMTVDLVSGLDAYISLLILLPSAKNAFRT